MTLPRQRVSLNATIDTAFGPVELHWDDSERLTAIRMMPATPSKTNTSLADAFSPLVDAIVSYFDGNTIDFLPFLRLWDSTGSTDYRRRVYDYVATIPYGDRQRYADVAAAIESPKSMRAVGGAMGANPIPLIVPCHRVVAANGLGGFTAGCGVDLKRRMLELESRRP
jgi:methylated-DNA-[protein]-cysteine S-methyltransferase